MARRSGRTSGSARGWRAGLVDTLQMPPELVLDWPRLVWLGGELLTMENHRGIVEYTPRRIRIRIPLGHVIVEGEHLEIEAMTDTDITLRGRLRTVHMAHGSEGVHE